MGIVTQTDLTRFQATTAAGLVADAARATTPEELAKVTARIPELLVQLVASGNRHDIVTRMITDVADVVTRRLLALAEEELGPPPVRYLWLACGSQGRQEQTGVSDQDNCLILADGVDEAGMEYFAKLAKIVSDGLDTAGYFYCPGDMMATNPRWCQPLSVWREYFEGWIKSPSKEAQMLASVMFDLRPIGGDETLFDGLQRYAAPVTVFGPIRAALYLGQMYLVLSSAEHVRELTVHFDDHIRAATVQPPDVPAFITRLRDVLTRRRG